MFCDGLRCLLKLRIAGKRLISSQRVAGPNGIPRSRNGLLTAVYVQWYTCDGNCLPIELSL